MSFQTIPKTSRRFLLLAPALLLCILCPAMPHQAGRHHRAGPAWPVVDPQASAVYVQVPNGVARPSKSRVTATSARQSTAPTYADRSTGYWPLAGQRPFQQYGNLSMAPLDWTASWRISKQPAPPTLTLRSTFPLAQAVLALAALCLAAGP